MVPDYNPNHEALVVLTQMPHCVLFSQWDFLLCGLAAGLVYKNINISEFAERNEDEESIEDVDDEEFEKMIGNLFTFIIHRA